MVCFGFMFMSMCSVVCLVSCSSSSGGFGFQGGKLADLKDIFGKSSKRVVASVSRAITANGYAKLAAQIDKAKLEL